jgi:hypothetical protein
VLEAWDTVGQEIDHSIVPIYVRDTAAALPVREAIQRRIL